MQLINFAGKYKIFAFISFILASLSALLAVIPIWYIWQIIICVIFRENLDNISRYSIISLDFALSAIILYLAGLVFSHKVAFKISSNIKINLLKHISLLPLGVVENLDSDYLQWVILESSSGAENYFSLNLPNKFAALASSVGLVGLLFYIDWRFALLSLAPLVIGFVLMAMMTNDSIRNKLIIYSKALNLLSSETLEYIKNLPVTRMFGTSEHSFKKFKHVLDNYDSSKAAYTSEIRLPIMAFTIAVNGAFIFLILSGVFIASRFGVSREFVQNFILAAIAAPIISINLMRVTRQDNNAISRINEILALKPLSYDNGGIGFPVNPDIELKNVSFSYNKAKILSDINLTIKAGQTLALVGDSDSEKITLAKLIARFFDVNDGKIFIGGIDIRDLDIDELTQKISFYDSGLNNDSQIIIVNDSDFMSDSDFQEALKKFSPDKTIIIISHKLTSLTQANFIALLDGGKLIESGNYGELMNQDSKFKEYIKGAAKIVMAQE